MNIEKIKQDLQTIRRHTRAYSREVTDVQQQLDRNIRETKLRHIPPILKLVTAIEEELDEEEAPKLAIHDGVLCFEKGGTVPWKGVGVSRRELLNRANGEFGGLGSHDLDFYMLLPIEYRLNFERHNTTNNYHLLKQYLDSRQESNIVVMLTYYDQGHEYHGHPYSTFAWTMDYPNVIHNPVNELYNQRHVEETLAILEYFKQTKPDCITAAGGFGSGMEKHFNALNPFNEPLIDVIDVHRARNKDGTWNPLYLERFRDCGKPFMRTEFFRVRAKRMKTIMRDDFAMGSCAENYYGLRAKALFSDLEDDPDPYLEYYEQAQKVKEGL